MKKEIRILGIPMDLGQNKRGVDMGSGAIRYARLLSKLIDLGYKVKDLGNIEVPVRDSLSEDKLLSTICQTCEKVYQKSREIVKEGSIPIFLGGDHSISIGTIGGVTHESPCGVIWIDAHGDFNTHSSSPSGNVHGMPMAVLSGIGDKALTELGRPGKKVPAEDVVLLAIRSLDPGEKSNLKKSGVTVFTMRDIDKQGISAIADQALAKLAHLPRIHVSLDMDSLDPSIAPGVGTPVPGGLTRREAHFLMETIAETGRCCSMDIVEINPLVDQNNETSQFAVELTQSLFGKRIL